MLQNIPFNVIDWDKLADKFNVGVDVDNNDTVVCVDGSDLRARLDSLLPLPPRQFRRLLLQLTMSQCFFSPVLWHDDSWESTMVNLTTKI